MKYLNRLRGLWVATTARLTIRGKIVTLYVLCIMLPTALVGGFSFLQNLDAARTQSLEAMLQSVTATRVALDERLSSYLRLMTQISFDESLEKKIEQQNGSMFSLIALSQDITSFFQQQAVDFPELKTLRILHNNPRIPQDGRYFILEDDVRGQPWYRYVIRHPESQWKRTFCFSYLTTHGVPLLALVQPAINVFRGQRWGWVRLDLNGAQALSSLTTTSTEMGWQLIVNRAGMLVGGDWPEQVLGEFPQQGTPGFVQQIPARAVGRFGATIGNVPCCVLYAGSPSGMTVIRIVPDSMLFGNIKAIGLQVVFTCVSFILISGMVMLLLGNNIRHRLGRLTGNIQRIERGDLAIQTTGQNGDEIGQLDASIYQMANRLGALMDQVAVAQIRRRQEELKALQAQINPHFLYNTLASIRAIAALRKENIICQLVDAMATFYRLSLNRGDENLPLRQEIELTRCYVVIQQIRFPDQFEVEWEMDPDILECQTIKLILQPLVENAICHGLADKEDLGHLRISGAKVGEDIRLVVQDDGVGIDQATITQVLSGSVDVTSRSRGYGVRNVHERIQLYFGQQYGLRIESELAQGTRVEIRIPAWRGPGRPTEELTSV